MALSNETGNGSGGVVKPPRPPSTPSNGGRPHPPPSASRPSRRRRNPPPSNTSYNNNKSQNRSRAANRRRSNRPQSPNPPQPPTSKVIVPTAPPKPVAPDLQKFLAGDSTYQKQLAGFNKSLADFGTDQGLAKRDYTTNYNNTYRDIGLAKGDASKSLQDDFASRGLLKSGLYNQSLGELNQQYQNQYGDLSKQQLAFLAQLGQEGKKYQNEQSLQKQNARDEAARRRAEKYNL